MASGNRKTKVTSLQFHILPREAYVLIGKWKREYDLRLFVEQWDAPETQEFEVSNPNVEQELAEKMPQRVWLCFPSRLADPRRKSIMFNIGRLRRHVLDESQLGASSSDPLLIRHISRIMRETKSAAPQIGHAFDPARNEPRSGKTRRITTGALEEHLGSGVVLALAGKNVVKIS